MIEKTTYKNVSGYELPCITIIKEFNESFLMSGSWIKPSLLWEECPIETKYLVTSQINIEANLNLPRRSHDGVVKFKAKQLLHEVLDHYDDIPLCMDQDQYQYFMKVLEEVYHLKITL